MSQNKVALKNFTEEELKEFVKSIGEPAFRGSQIYSWIYKGAKTFDDMKNIPKSLREKLEEVSFIGNLKIELSSDKRQNLLLTGKNGSGKTSLLLKIEKFLKAINDEQLSQIFEEYPMWIREAKKQALSASSENEKYKIDQDVKLWTGYLQRYSDGVQVNLNQYDGLEMLYDQGKFITAYFPSERKAQFMRPNGVENITLENTYGIDKSAGNILLKYMVHLKTQQAYARNEGDQTTADKIQQWFD